MSNPFDMPPEAVFLPSSVTIRKSRRETSRFIPSQGRLVIEDSGGEDSDPEGQVGGVSPPPLEAEWLSRQQGLLPTKRDSKQSDVAPRWSLTSANAIDKNDPFVLTRGKHMAWAVNNNKSQLAGESDSRDRHFCSPQIPGAFAPPPHDKANDSKPECI